MSSHDTNTQGTKKQQQQKKPPLYLIPQQWEWNVGTKSEEWPGKLF